MSKEIYTGLYLFGEINSNTSFGGVSGRITLPSYKKDVMFYLNDKCKHKVETIDDATVYSFSVSELEGLYSALEKIINDIRKLEVLSKRDLLREEAYSLSE